MSESASPSPLEARPCSETAARRLGVFTGAQVGEFSRQLESVPIAPSPRIEGCLAVLVTSRSGSTYLARELECVFDIGRMRESLNPAQVKDRSAAEIVAQRRDAWFAFKAGVPGVIAGEFRGFFDAYLARTSFIVLSRRDIVAQAVSCVKANQTRRWHSTQKSNGPGFYDRAKIAQYISVIASGVERLRLYVQRTDRPWLPLVYEDFAQGDFTRAMTACDDLGVPRRSAGSPIQPKPVERIGDATNEAWAARFQQEMDSATGKLIERYLAELSLAGFSSVRVRRAIGRDLNDHATRRR